MSKGDKSKSKADKGPALNGTVEEDMISMGRRLIEDGASLSNLAGRAVFAQLDRVTKEAADAQRYARLLAESNERLDQTITEIDGEHAEFRRKTMEKIEHLTDLAERRLSSIRRLRAQRDRTPAPADLYGPQVDEMRDAGPFAGDSFPFPGAGGDDTIGTAIHEFIEDVFGKQDDKGDTLTMDTPPQEVLDMLFGKGNAPAGLSLGKTESMMVPVDAPTDDDGIPWQVREQLTASGLLQPGDKLVRVGDNGVAVLSAFGTCSDPSCLACSAVNALSGSEPSAQSTGHPSAGERLNGAQVRDLAPGTAFRMVAMEGKDIPAYVLPAVRRLLGPDVAQAPVFRLLTDEGMPVPSGGLQREAFELTMDQLDKRDARFVTVG